MKIEMSVRLKHACQYLAEANTGHVMNSLQGSLPSLIPKSIECSTRITGEFPAAVKTELRPGGNQVKHLSSDQVASWCLQDDRWQLCGKLPLTERHARQESLPLFWGDTLVTLGIVW